VPFAAAQAPSATDLGVVTTDLTQSSTHGPGEVRWYTFTVPTPAQSGLSTYFDMTTNGTSFDTEMGLYDAAGNFLFTDDDDGTGFQSTLTFGSGSGLTLGDSFNLGGNGIAEGEDGDLPAGQYYLALAQFNATFNATNWDVTSTGTSSGSMELAIYTNVPVPVELQSFSID